MGDMPGRRRGPPPTRSSADEMLSPIYPRTLIYNNKGIYGTCSTTTLLSEHPVCNPARCQVPPQKSVSLVYKIVSLCTGRLGRFVSIFADTSYARGGRARVRVCSG
jgi:hypothetical protein